jgi:hypothetical protein
MNSLNSIYIPRMSLSVNEKIITEEFAKTLGEVLRVDFTCIDKKPGFNENHHPLFKSVFVHFKRFYNDMLSHTILKLINSENSYKYYPQCKKEYWILLKAKNPISETCMNNAQIVENCRYLEKKLELQEDKIKYLQETLEKVLYYCHNSDQEIQDTLLLHRKQEIFQEKRNACNFSVSTHSSMPGLINCYDYNTVSSSSSIEDLEENNNSSDSEKRLRNSFELCGNE